MRAIIFDMGGVVIKDTTLKEQIFGAFDVQDRDAFWRLFNDLAMPACRGEQPLSECWRQIAKAMGRSLDEEVYRSLWIDNFMDSITIDAEVMAIVDRLRGKYQLGVVSNTIHEHASILRTMGVYRKFDHIVLSHEVGITKDDPRIFDIALRGLGAAPEEAVFIDDVEKFALSAASRGIKSIVFKSSVQLRNDLQSMGIELKSDR